MKKWHLPFLLFLIIGTVLILKGQRPVLQGYSGHVFGTTCHIKYFCSRPLDDDIESAMLRVDNSLSMFNGNSTLSRVNRNEDLDVSSDTTFIRVFRLAMDISELTDGAFDVTVAPAVNAWGFGFKESEDITKTTIDSLRQITGYQKVRLTDDGLIIKDDPRIMMDFSAIAKGFGCDVVAAALSANGVKDFMVEIGGEIVVRGKNGQDKKWSIGVSEPDENLSEGNLRTILHLTDCAMATSGNYRNYYVRDGVRYAHTIDPKTCMPVSHDLLSATVIAADCATADALATSFMVMGTDRAVTLTRSHPDIKAYLIVSKEEGRDVIDLTDGITEDR
ncbi:MAG: FAD:protein FMN transferase [Bacteroidaceae bacterium]|nr:FAD:protein FMN transferase [Bacteroidaceae bacterium]